MSARSAAAVLAALQGHLPPGWAWPRDPDAALTRLLSVPAGEIATIEAALLDLLQEASDPRRSLHLLPDWERLLGLPDPCAAPLPTLQGRRRAAYAQFTMQGGQSRAYFTAVAAALGYAVTIQEFRPSRFGQAFGQPFGGEAWAHTWQVTAPGFVRTRFQFGHGGFGEPFSSWGGAVLECTLNRLKPAHTVLRFSYVDAIGAPLGAFVLGRDTLSPPP